MMPAADHAARRQVMALCAGATRKELDAALAGMGRLPSATDLRPGESGLVMLRGRMGGDGRAFNVGEASVTRAAVRLDDGRTGFAYQLGRDKDRAPLRRPARCALAGAPSATPSKPRWSRSASASPQTPPCRPAASPPPRVDFFTMVRGED